MALLHGFLAPRDPDPGRVERVMELAMVECGRFVALLGGVFRARVAEQAFAPAAGP